jgi:hypothetical protein
VGNAAFALSKQLWSLWVTRKSYPSESVTAAYPQTVILLLNALILLPHLPQNSPYHVSLGLCPYIPSFCFRDKSGDSLMLNCCLSGLMEESSLSPLYRLGYIFFTLLVVFGFFCNLLVPVPPHMPFAFSLDYRLWSLLSLILLLALACFLKDY